MSFRGLSDALGLGDIENLSTVLISRPSKPACTTFFFEQKKSFEFILATGLSVLDHESFNLCFLTLFASTLPNFISATGFPVLDVASLLADALDVMDRGEVEVEEEKQARVKSAPVLPTDKERERERERLARGHACDVSQLVRGVCGSTCDRRFPQTFSD